MRAPSPSLKILIYGILVFTCASTFGDAAVSVTVSNNTGDNLLVTVYDLNNNPVVRVVSSQTINSFASISITITADASGQGHLSWTATTVSQYMRRCGHHDRRHVNNGDTVRVYANSQCPRK